jgi:hypothetical protein
MPAAMKKMKIEQIRELSRQYAMGIQPGKKSTKKAKKPAVKKTRRRKPQNDNRIFGDIYKLNADYKRRMERED